MSIALPTVAESALWLMRKQKPNDTRQIAGCQQWPERCRKAQRLADAAGFYRAFGVGVNAGTERPDHIRAELEFMDYLCFKGAYADDRGLPKAWEIMTAARRFLAEHLGRWTPLFFKRFETVSAQPLYRAVITFARAFQDDEATRLGSDPSR